MAKTPSSTISLPLSPQTKEFLDAVAAVGYLGETPEKVATHLLSDGIARLIDSEFLRKAMMTQKMVKDIKALHKWKGTRA